MGEVYEGYVEVRREAPLGLITLRADLDARRVISALKALIGDLPPPRRIVAGPSGHSAWMAPDELLIFAPPDAVTALVARVSDALAGLHHTVVDVSDARVLLGLAGARVREVLAKLTPADVERLPEGEMRRSRLGQVAAAFWLPEEGRARILVARSVADYAFDLLAVSARPGSEVL